MTKLQRAKSIMAGLIMILTSVIMFRYPADSYAFILFFIGTGFLVTGIGRLIYYFTMARYMVGGKMTLYMGVILVDFAVLTTSLVNVPKVYILVYLAVIHAFSGLIEVLRARETRQTGSGRFKLKFFHGILNISMALCCLIFINRTNTAIFVYCLGLAYSGLIRVITAFRRSTFVYIQ